MGKVYNMFRLAGQTRKITLYLNLLAGNSLRKFT